MSGNGIEVNITPCQLADFIAAQACPDGQHVHQSPLAAFTQSLCVGMRLDLGHRFAPARPDANCLQFQQRAPLGRVEQARYLGHTQCLPRMGGLHTSPVGHPQANQKIILHSPKRHGPFREGLDRCDIGYLCRLRRRAPLFLTYFLYRGPFTSRRLNRYPRAKNIQSLLPHPLTSAAGRNVSRFWGSYFRFSFDSGDVNTAPHEF